VQGSGPWISIFVVLTTLAYTALIWRAFEQTEIIEVRSIFWMALLWGISAFTAGETTALIGGACMHSDA